MNTLARKLRMNTIRSIMTWSFSVLILLMLSIVAVLLYDKFSETAERSVYLNTQQIVDQVGYNLEDYITGMSRLYRSIEQNMLVDGQWEDEQVTKQLDTIMSSRDDIVSIALFDEQGKLLRNRPSAQVRDSADVTQQSWFHAAMRVPDHLGFSLPHIQNLYQGTYKWVVSMSKGVTVIRNGKPMRVILLVDINFKKIDELSSRISLGKKGYVYIIDEGAGNIVYHPQQQLIYMGLKKESVEQALKSSDSYIDRSSNVPRLITVKSVANIGWKVVGVSYLDEIMTTREEINRYLIRVLAGALVLVIIFCMLLASTLTRPIRLMERTMKAVEKGDFEVELPVQGPLEVERLASRFNLMVNKIRQLMQQIIVEQESKRKYELEALQAQINPHFLYNTLNSVVRMVGMSKNEEVITMITSLSRLFRISLSKGKNVIAVGEELEHARHYLTIQQMRFKNKFAFAIEADEEALSCMTLKLVLQPLIENAIVHGIEYMVDEGFIRIKASVTGDVLTFEIADNGVGMSPGKLDRLLSGEAIDKSGAGSGVAVRNVHDRIRLYYGVQYGLSFESEQEEGTTVRVRIPAIRAVRGETVGDE
ncbi:histidine kinase [Paenibacillus darwinianus]|uniref:histidine kinase n=1 Tax=Paenibacillus darwinianus TaxID=1380763 RepID=A0A9W5W846_9BACL|nr:sensor histidine kinase [Paenibacillus darwinianus]EXX85218.1 histidine kinase [Paenibacillus darwinianus]EXX85241.1 histidine kinase [Paenibacillus darwinianus]EXX89810.1 histidine kinase [Paenibacillus darwinianus]